MLNFRNYILWMMSFAPVGVAAEFTLLDEGKLKGDFIRLSEDGTIGMRSPFSLEPLTLDSGHVLKVLLAAPLENQEIPDQRIFLVNGDVIPASITHLDSEIIRVTSPFFGELEVPRKMVDSVQLGIVEEKVIYDGFGAEEEWVFGMDGSRMWKLTNDVMVSSGQGVATRDFKLPEKYAIRFVLRWIDQPNFRLNFGDPLKAGGERSNRYFLHFMMAGLSLKREMEGEGREVLMALNNRRPDQYADKSVDLELRVDQSKGLVHLYINGQLEGKYEDVLTELPEGSGISLVSYAQGKARQFVSGFQITAWDDRGDRHRTEERGDMDEDSLIGRNGERFGGELQAIEDGDGGKVFRFKSDYQKDAIELPESEVSTVFFAKAKDTDVLEGVEGWVVGFSGDGRLALNNCEYEEGVLKFTHPLLGKIELKSEVVGWLEKRKVPKAKKIKGQ
jgi:hypothetical protein